MAPREQGSSAGLKMHPLTPLALAVGLAATCAAIAALFGLWLLTAGIFLGLLVRVLLLVRHLRCELPRRLALYAASRPWRDAGIGNEELVESYLAAMANAWPPALRRAERLVVGMVVDAADRSVALERLGAARARLRPPPRRPLHVRVRAFASKVRSAGVSVSAGGGALMLLSESTPGPVLDYPWRAWTAITAAAVVSTVYGRHHGDVR